MGPFYFNFLLYDFSFVFLFTVSSVEAAGGGGGGVRELVGWLARRWRKEGE